MIIAKHDLLVFYLDFTSKLKREFCSFNFVTYLVGRYRYLTYVRFENRNGMFSMLCIFHVVLSFMTMFYLNFMFN